jgi:(p)ppGpp synthase/HD superfamily hydrolase
LAELEDETDRWIDVHWHSGKHPAIYNVTVNVTIRNDAGVLGRICTLIGEQKANISDMHFADRKSDFFRLLIDIDMRDVEHLHMVMTALEADTDVAAIDRFRDVTRQP